MFFFAVLVKHDLNLLFALCQKFITGVKLRVSQPVSKPAYFVELREEIMMRVRKSREGQLHNLLQQLYSGAKGKIAPGQRLAQDGLLFRIFREVEHEDACDYRIEPDGLIHEGAANSDRPFIHPCQMLRLGRISWNEIIREFNHTAIIPSSVETKKTPSDTPTRAR